MISNQTPYRRIVKVCDNETGYSWWAMQRLELLKVGAEAKQEKWRPECEWVHAGHEPLMVRAEIENGNVITDERYGND